MPQTPLNVMDPATWAAYGIPGPVRRAGASLLDCFDVAPDSAERWRLRALLDELLKPWCQPKLKPRRPVSVRVEAMSPLPFDDWLDDVGATGWRVVVLRPWRSADRPMTIGPTCTDPEAFEIREQLRAGRAYGIRCDDDGGRRVSVLPHQFADTALAQEVVAAVLPPVAPCASVSEALAVLRIADMFVAWNWSPGYKAYVVYEDGGVSAIVNFLDTPYEKRVARGRLLAATADRVVSVSGAHGRVARDWFPAAETEFVFPAYPAEPEGDVVPLARRRRLLTLEDDA